MERLHRIWSERVRSARHASRSHVHVRRPVALKASPPSSLFPHRYNCFCILSFVFDLDVHLLHATCDTLAAVSASKRNARKCVTVALVNLPNALFGF